MSVNAMRKVWRARLESTRKLTLLALADWADDAGGSCHPSLQAIADKVCISRSQAQRHVRWFIEQELVSVVANQFGGKPGSTPHYRLHLDRIAALADTDSADAIPTDSASAAPTGRMNGTPTGSTSATGSADATGSTHAQEGSHGCTGGVAPMRQTGSTGATQTTINHQRTIREPSEKRAREARARPAADLLPEVTKQALDDWDAVRKAKRAGPLTETAAKGFKREVEKAGCSLQQAVELCCAKGWAGFNADWDEVRRLTGRVGGASSRQLQAAALMTGAGRRSGGRTYALTDEERAAENARNNAETKRLLFGKDYSEGLSDGGILTA